MPFRPSNLQLTLLGGLIALLGLVLSAMYVYGAIIERAGEPDQSLLFWYLPFLFAGVFFLAAGLALIAVAWYRSRQR